MSRKLCSTLAGYLGSFALKGFQDRPIES